MSNPTGRDRDTNDVFLLHPSIVCPLLFCIWARRGCSIPVLQNPTSSSLGLKWQAAVCLTKENLCSSQGHSVFGWLSVPLGSGVFIPSACCWRREAEGSRCGDKLTGETRWSVAERTARRCYYNPFTEFGTNNLLLAVPRCFLNLPEELSSNTLEYTNESFLSGVTQDMLSCWTKTGNYDYLKPFHSISFLSHSDLWEFGHWK